MYYYSECVIINFEYGSVQYPFGREVGGVAIHDCDDSQGYFWPEGVTPNRTCTTTGWTGFDDDIYCDSKLFVQLFRLQFPLIKNYIPLCI